MGLSRRCEERNPRLRPRISDQPTQGGAARKAPAAVAQRRVHACPGFAGRAFDQSGGSGGPAPMPGAVGLGPGQDLRLRQLGEGLDVAHSAVLSEEAE